VIGARPCSCLLEARGIGSAANSGVWAVTDFVGFVLRLFVSVTPRRRFVRTGVPRHPGLYDSAGARRAIFGARYAGTARNAIILPGGWR
jgi:hypothetical protein